MKYKEERKCLLFSIVIHLSILVFFSMNSVDNIKQESIKETAINLVEYTTNAGNMDHKVENLVKENAIVENKKKVEKQEKQVEDKKQEVEVKKPIEKKIETDTSSKQVKEVPEKEPQIKNEKNSEEKNGAQTEETQISKEGSSDIETSITYGQFGEKIGKNQNISGLKYQILVSKDPEYPKQAKKFKIKEAIVIKTRFLVGIDGEIEDIQIVDGTEKFGFRDAVKDCIAQWKFSPIEYKGEKIKMYFYKDFVFKIE